MYKRTEFFKCIKVCQSAYNTDWGGVVRLQVIFCSNGICGDTTLSFLFWLLLNISLKPQKRSLPLSNPHPWAHWLKREVQPEGGSPHRSPGSCSHWGWRSHWSWLKELPPWRQSANVHLNTGACMKYSTFAATCGWGWGTMESQSFLNENQISLEALLQLL